MTQGERKCAGDPAVGQVPHVGDIAEERHEILMSALPMLIVFAMWFVAQVCLVGPLLFR